MHSPCWWRCRSAGAEVLCKKKSGVVVVRVACKAKETAIDIAEFGALGPRGADGETGVAGPQGPPGAGFSLTLGTSQSHRAYPIMSGIVDLPAGTHTFGYGQTVSGNWGSSGGGGGQTTLLMLGN